MPVYEFVCEKHGKFEEITIKAEWKDIRCPKCGKKVKKVMSAPSMFQIHGFNAGNGYAKAKE